MLRSVFCDLSTSLDLVLGCACHGRSHAEICRESQRARGLGAMDFAFSA